MKFGSEQFYQKLKSGMYSGADEVFYTNILSEIENDIRPRVSSMVAYPDDDDVIQQALLAVWTSLAKFVRSSEELSVSQRNAWLMRIVNNKIADYYRSKYGSLDNAYLNDTREFVAPADMDPSILFERLDSQLDGERRIDAIIEYIFSLNILPEKIIAFFYSKVIFFIKSSGMIKGSAKYAYDSLNGRKFSEVLPKFRQDLDFALGRALPLSLYDLIYQKVGPDNMDCTLEIRLQTITDSTGYIIKRIRKDEQFHLR